MIAEINGKAIGFADYTANKGHVKYLFVFPHIRGSSAGTSLLDAVQAKVPEPISIHVLAVNDVGILWYLRLGSRVSGSWAEPFEGEMAAWLKLVRDARSLGDLEGSITGAREFGS